MDSDAEAVYVDILRSLQTSILNPPSVSVLSFFLFDSVSEKW